MKTNRAGAAPSPAPSISTSQPKSGVKPAARPARFHLAQPKSLPMSARAAAGVFVRANHQASSSSEAPPRPLL